MVRRSVNLMKGSAMVFLIIMLMVGGARGRELVINESKVPIAIQRAASNGLNDSVVVGGQSSMQMPAAFSGSDITLRNQITGGTFGPFTLRRNTVMLVQSTSGLVSNTVNVLLGTFIKGIISALTTLISGL